MYFNFLLGQASLMNCLGIHYKLGAAYDYYHHKTVHEVAEKIEKITDHPNSTSISTLHLIENATLHSMHAYGIDEHFKLRILLGVHNSSQLEHEAAAKAFVQFCSDDRSMALHFRCITKIETASSLSQFSHQEATHVVGEISYGLEAFFIINYDAYVFESCKNVSQKIKSSLAKESFDEVADISGTLVLFASENLKLPFEVRTIQEMNSFYHFIEENRKEIYIVPVAINFFQ